MNRISIFVLLAGALVALPTLVACATDPDHHATPQGFLVSGTVPAGTDPDSSVIIAWERDSGDDAVILFGRSPISNAGFAIGLPEDVPANAVNADGTAAGLVLLVDSSTPLPEDGGELDGDAVLSHVRGSANLKNVIWLGEGSETSPDWTSTFEPGYACGRCIAKTGDEEHDSFDQTTCDFPIESTPTFCNWE